MMEKILGGKIQSTSELGLEGLKDAKDTENIFFEVPDSRSTRATFRLLTNGSEPPAAQFGGASEYGCSIELPNGTSFHAMQIHGDIVGWKEDVQKTALQLDLSLAKIKGNFLSVDEDHQYPLSDCSINFF